MRFSERIPRGAARRAIGVGVAVIAVMVCCWLWGGADAGAPAPLAVAGGGDAGAAPAPAAVVDSPERAAPAPSTNRTSVPHIRVHGVLANVDAPCFVANGTARPRIEPAAGGAFVVELTPTAKLAVITATSSGRFLECSFVREDASAGRDWELGVVDFGRFDVAIEVEVHVSPQVVAALVGSGQRRLAVQKSADPRPDDVLHTFDLAAVEPGASMLSTNVRARVVEPERPVAIWWGFADATLSVPFVRMEAEVIGERRQRVRLDLLPESVVCGSVRWPDGEAAPEVLLSCSCEGNDPGWQRVRSGPEGQFCFVVGRGRRGRIEAEGLEQALGAVSAPRPFSAGDVVEIVRPARLRFRVVDEGGMLVTDYQVESALPRSRAGDLRFGEVAYELVAVLERYPWLRVYVRGGVCTFRVPAEWFAGGDRVHELRMSSAEPTGSVEVDVGGRALEPGERLEMEGEADFAGMKLSFPAPARGPWVVEGVPVGSYRTSLERYGVRRVDGRRIVVRQGANTVAEMR